jgi:tetratricopeptide (TPR) repeat protein
MAAMHQDAYGLEITSDSERARQTYDRAVRALLGWEATTLELFREATTHDPALALAHSGAAVCLFLEERFGEARAATETARAAVAGQSARERSHVEALALWTGGNLVEAERAMRAHLADFPRDVVMVQRLYMLWFWQGRFPEMLELTTAMLPHYPGTSFVLGLHAFALEEADRCADAARAAEAALALDPSDAWAVHALAHALYESADFDTGVTRLPAAIHPCRGLGWFKNHLYWHLALLNFARGEYERAGAMSRRVFERVPSAIAGDLHDSISLLWRLDLAGRPVGERWQPFTAIARERLNRQGLLFHVAHIAMALAAGGDWPAAERHLEMTRARVAKDSSGLTGDVLVPLVQGLHAFAAGDYARTVSLIEPLRPRIVELGGSRAQRDVFHDTLFEAAFRAGDTARAAAFLAERLARRPDRFWQARAAPSTRAR